MDYKEVKELVEYFEDRILINFEVHFSYLVLEDFYSDGDVGRIEDEWFYEEYFSEFEDGIVNLLWEIKEENEKYNDFQLRLIKLKRIIDTKLARTNNRVEFNIPIKKSRDNSFLIILKEKKDEFIKSLYDELSYYNFIETDLKLFESIFINKINTINKIQWKGTEIQITTLFSTLIEKKYFDPELVNFKYKLIKTHFLNKNGKEFNSKQLSSVYADKKVMIPEDDSILKIIEKISTHF